MQNYDFAPGWAAVLSIPTLTLVSCYKQPTPKKTIAYVHHMVHIYIAYRKWKTGR